MLHSGADMTNSVVDRVAFDGSNLSGVNFTNAVITGATFKGTNLEGASFEDALIGNEDAKRLCVSEKKLPHRKCQAFPWHRNLMSCCSSTCIEFSAHEPAGRGRVMSGCMLLAVMTI